MGCHDHSQHHQGEEQCYHGRPHTERHSRVSLKSVTANDGVSDKRIRGHQRGQEQRSSRGVVQKGCSQQINKAKRHDKRGQTEHHKAVLVAFKTAAVHLKSCQKHDVIQAHAPEEFERVVSFQNVKPVFAHCNARQHHANDMGDAQFAHHDRGKKDDKHHDEEDQRGVGDGEGREHCRFAYGGLGVIIRGVCCQKCQLYCAF